MEPAWTSMPCYSGSWYPLPCIEEINSPVTGNNMEAGREASLRLAASALPRTFPGTCTWPLAFSSLLPHCSPVFHIIPALKPSSISTLKSLFLLVPGYFHKSFVLKSISSVLFTTTFLKFIPLPHSSANVLIPEGGPSHLNAGNILASWLPLLPPSSLPERK